MQLVVAPKASSQHEPQMSKKKEKQSPTNDSLPLARRGQGYEDRGPFRSKSRSSWLSEAVDLRVSAATIPYCHRACDRREQDVLRMIRDTTSPVIATATSSMYLHHDRLKRHVMLPATPLITRR
jgi:hypothetical protein